MAGPSAKGVYHKVQRGETIWRIAKAYQVGIDEIVRSNNIPNAANVEENQLVFVPGADAVKKIIIDKDDLNKNEFIWPVKGKIITYFGDSNRGQFYRGILIQAQDGDSVHAARDGQVVFADYLQGYGYAIILDHLDGYFTVYARNSALASKLGEYVPKGHPIANVGKRGDAASLHFEIRRNSQAQNPLYYLP